MHCREIQNHVKHQEVNYFCKRAFLAVWQGSEYASVLSISFNIFAAIFPNVDLNLSCQPITLLCYVA